MLAPTKLDSGLPRSMCSRYGFHIAKGGEELEALSLVGEFGSLHVHEGAYGKLVFSSQAQSQSCFFFHILCTHWNLSEPRGRRNLFPYYLMLLRQKTDDCVGIWGLIIEAV